MPAYWYVSHAGRDQGPLSAAKLKGLADEGAIIPDDLVWKEGMADRVPASKVRGLFAQTRSPSGSRLNQGSTPGPVRESVAREARLIQPVSDDALAGLALLTAHSISRWSSLYHRPVTPFEAALIDEREACMRCSEHVHFHPLIPAAKLKNAREHFAGLLGPDELMLCLIDNTAFGSAKLGCLCTTRKLHWKNPMMKPSTVEYAMLDPSRVAYEARYGHAIRLADKLAIGLESIDGAEAIAIADFVKGLTLIHDQAKRTSEQAAVTAYRRKQRDTAEVVRRAQLDREKLLEGEPTTAEHFFCSGCNSQLGLEKAGTSLACPTCQSALYVPEPPPCPVCKAKETHFHLGKFEAKLTGLVLAAR